MRWNMRAFLVWITVYVGFITMSATAMAEQVFYHTVTGEVLQVLVQSPPEGRATAAVRRFLATGINPYNEVRECLAAGEESYLASCSGCHGHVAEGKVGPGLNDDYWTYPKNKTDKGLFETIFGGAQGMMGPHADLPLDETLMLMAWIRHLYTGSVADADWLSDTQKKKFKPYKAQHDADASGASATKAKQQPQKKCKVSGG
jgi:cytochrome c-L